MDTLSHLVIKPTLACTANCKTCSGRKDLHKELRHTTQLSFEQWSQVLSDAASLGVKTFTISGGEPTLYRNLIGLVKLGHSFGWRVGLNSNGSLFTEAMVHELLEAGLNGVHISIYSAIPELHDAMRNAPGLHAKASESVRIFARLSKGYPFTLKAQTILDKDNYKNFADTLIWHYSLGAAATDISYLEGDYDKTSLLNREEIADFRNNVVPKAVSFFRKQGINAESGLRRIFSQDVASVEDWANGVYWSRDRGCPHVKRGVLLLLANGDAHPCNIVEYIHEPIVGNLLNSSLPDIWHSEVATQYRQRFHDSCRLCPMNLHLEVEYCKVAQIGYASKVKRTIRRTVRTIVVDSRKKAS